jgi:hypothetical protein
MKKEFKGTKGEWSLVQTPNSENYGIVKFSDGYGLALIDSDWNFEEEEANLRLISAAPDLLVFAMDFIEKVESGRAKSNDSYNKALVAVNKALGTNENNIGDITKKSYGETYAENEFNLLLKEYSDPDDEPLIKEFIPEILNLVKKFSKSGQSGGSAPYVANSIASTVKELCLHKPLLPIKGSDDEWGHLVGGLDLIQNKRLTSLFKYPNGDVSYVDAIVWKTQNGTTWTGSCTLKDGREIRSSAYVKRFPFIPKTFVIDVIEYEIAKDDWNFEIEDEKQLEEVFEYYNPQYKN